jgi:hypothetical protein
MVWPVIDSIAARLPAAGLFVGAAAWGIQPLICAQGAAWPLALLSSSLICISLAGAWISYRDVGEEDPQGPNPRRMLRWVGTAAGVLFALTILVQGLAALFLTGCER